jgi:hypothetical protein
MNRKTAFMRHDLNRCGLAAVLALGFGAAALSASLPAAAQFQAQMPPECTQFGKLRDVTAQKASLVRNATQKGTADRKEVCALITSFATSEAAMVKFLEDNKTWCGIPDQAVVQAKAGHEKTMKFRTAACAEGGPPGKPKPPSLSDAIGTMGVDTSTNTTTGRGTFDTLTGNPLAR